MNSITQEPLQYIQVAVPVPMRQLFTYQVPLLLQKPLIKKGERVIVPFAGRHLVAIVIEISNKSNISLKKLKNILARQKDPYYFSEQEVNFLQQCARYYHHPIGEVIHQALPVLLRQTKTIEIPSTEVWRTQTVDDLSVELKKLEKKAVKQHALYQIIAARPDISWPDIRGMGYTKTQLKALHDKKLIVAQQMTPTTFLWKKKYLNQENKHFLTVEQAIVVSRFLTDINCFSCHLLEGITGSGKTEVYLQIMETVLAKNKQVLVLVPEIGLTPQILSRFEQRFNLPIYLHHSGLNNNQRLQTWLSSKRGNAAIIIGTRSAVFSPLLNAGLIIVDEEHDSSLKQQDSFRYHARDLAILRARQLNIPILLGSATPSLETLHNALTGKYHHHQLLQRPGSSIEAKIELIDMAKQQVNYGISASLLAVIEQTLVRGEQVLIFLNRRGFAPAVSCQECHDILTCERCNKPYTLHQIQRLMICHHCGGQKRVPKQCGQCGSVRLFPMGQGTEQLEQRVAEKFNHYSTIRIDRDSTRRKGELAKLLQEVSENKHQILIGTQMLAKGHHFPNVTLVAVLDVDGALFSYDFRAAEQMAQLLVQVGGRAGRESKPGKVLVQTYYPEHALLQDLVNNGYHHFAQQALDERKLANLPPNSYQALIRAEAIYPYYPEQFLALLSRQTLKNCELAGPIPAAMGKKAGKYRYHLIIQAKYRRDLHKGVDQITKNIETNEWQHKVKWSIDIDPQDLSW